MRLANKVALITEAAGGVGSASARLFAQEGAAVVIAAEEENAGKALAKGIIAAGGKALFVKLDVVDQNQWEAAVTRVKDTFGALHILMNIVGTNALGMLPDIDLAAWNKMFETNVTSRPVVLPPAPPGWPGTTPPP